MKCLDKPECRAEVLARIEQLRPDSARLWGKMNAAQMVCHLNDAFLGVMGERHIPAMEKYRGRKIVKFFALHVPMQWPQGVPTRPEVDAFVGGTKPGQFDEDVATLRKLIAKFTGRPRSFEFEPHPIFLRMSEREWMTWGYRHIDHHLRQFGL